MKKRYVCYAVWLILACLLYFFENNTGSRIVLACSWLFPFVPLIRRSLFEKDAVSRQPQAIPQTIKTFANREQDDPGDVRAYLPGDPVNRIHWKLSSKKDEFIVKDYSLPVDIPSVIFLNLKCYDDSKYTLPVFDTLVESFISVSQFLIDNERSHTVVFFNGKAGCFMEYTIDSPEALSEVTRTLIFSVNDNLFCDPPEAYLLDNTDVEFSSFTFVTSQPDNDIIGKIDDSVNAELKNVIIVVKSPREAEALNASYPETEIYPVLLGRITASIKEIEL